MRVEPSRIQTLVTENRRQTDQIILTPVKVLISKRMPQQMRSDMHPAPLSVIPQNADDRVFLHRASLADKE